MYRSDLNSITLPIRPKIDWNFPYETHQLIAFEWVPMFVQPWSWRQSKGEVWHVRFGSTCVHICVHNLCSQSSLIHSYMSRLSKTNQARSLFSHGSITFKPWLLVCYIVHQMFSLACDRSKPFTWPNILQLKLGNIRDYFPIFKISARCEKDLKDNEHNSLHFWAKISSNILSWTVPRSSQFSTLSKTC